jgi:hypothetical protein
MDHGEMLLWHVVELVPAASCIARPTNTNNRPAWLA